MDQDFTVLEASARKIEIVQSTKNKQRLDVWVDDMHVGSIRESHLYDGWDAELWQNNQDIYFSQTYRTKEKAIEGMNRALELFQRDFLFKQLTDEQRKDGRAFWDNI